MDPSGPAATPLEFRLASAFPTLSGDVSRASWPTRVNRGVDLGFGFDFVRARPFEGAITHHQLAGLRTFSVVCEPHVVFRETSHLDERGDAYFLLTLQVSGRKTVRQGHEQNTIRTGDFTVYDSELPLLLDVSRDYRSYNVRIPKFLIPADRRRAFTELICQPLSVRDSLAAYVWSTIVGIDDLTEVPDPLSAQVTRQTVELTALLLSSRLRDEPVGGWEDDRARRLDAVKSFMEQHLDDSELTLDKVAAATYMSTRSLHKLFAESGVTAGAWLRSRRLEMAKRELANPLAGSIASIAVRCGFSSVSHFTQAFKQHAGVTPSEYRANAMS